MRLARNLIVGVAFVLLGVLSLEGYLDVQRAYAIFESDMRADGQLLGNAVSRAIAAARAGRAPELDAAVGDDRVEVRLVALDGSQTAAAPFPPTEAIKSQLARDGAAHFKDDERRLFTYVPLADRPGLALEISEDLEPLHAHGRTIAVRAVVRTGLTAVAFIVLVLVVGLIYVGNPLQQLVDMARRVGQGDYSLRLRFQRKDELRDLAETMNGMCDDLTEARISIERETKRRIAAIEQLRHADRLVTVGQLAAGVAHELGTPLNVIAGHAKMIVTGEVTGSEAAESARIALEQTSRMTNIVRQLLDFSRRRPAQRSRADVAEIATQTVHMLGTVAQKKDVELSLEVRKPGLLAQLDVVQIQQALANLIMNAIQAVPTRGHVSVEVQEGDGSLACIRVTDDGPGIPAEDRARVFEPFFTTKGVGEGTGLGLAVAIGLVKENGGSIEVTAAETGGAQLSILLPLATAEDALS
ncbi:MAG TPA: ATP-binding protein [Polyangiales bacterium]|nr:ATP-binding protein [Polyangiales bacterium]